MPLARYVLPDKPDRNNLLVRRTIARWFFYKVIKSIILWSRIIKIFQFHQISFAIYGTLLAGHIQASDVAVPDDSTFCSCWNDDRGGISHLQGDQSWCQMVFAYRLGSVSSHSSSPRRSPSCDVCLHRFVVRPSTETSSTLLLWLGSFHLTQ